MRKLFRYVSYFDYSWILKCILPYNLNSSRSDSLPSLLLLQKKWHALPILTLIKNSFFIFDVADIWVVVRTLCTDGCRCSQDGILGRNQQQKQGSGFKKTTFICILFRGSFTSLSDPAMVSLSYLFLVYVLLDMIITFTKLKNKKRQML